MVKNFLAIQLVLLLFIHVSGQEKSDREKSGLSGFVKSIKEEIADIDFENGKQVPGGRQLRSIQTYDISGRLLTDYAYTDDKEVLYADTLIYGPDGRLSEKKTEHSKSVYLCDRKTYVYYQDGRRAEEICHLTDLGAIGKTVSRYSESGKLVEEERFPLVEAKLYFSRHTLKRYEYNKAGNLIGVTNFQKEGERWVSTKTSIEPYNSVHFSHENASASTRVDYDANGKLVLINISLDDDRGNEKETVVYFSDGRIKEGNRYVYSYDGHGNYVKQIDYEWVTEEGRSLFRLSEVTYRTIKYFTPKQVSEYRKATRR